MGKNYAAQRIELKYDQGEAVSLREAAEMAILAEVVCGVVPVVAGVK